jgi:poly-gamma-glutamate synthesis protein (capsule biosynthesis protein)
MRRLLAVVATLVVIASIPVSAGASMLPPGGTFFDDDGSIHEGDIEAIAAAEITRGCGEADLFCPDRAVTRGQMAAFLTRALHLPPSDTNPFADDDTSVFEHDINALAAAGITRGCAPGAYCPDQAVTRGQMASFLARALHLTPIVPDPRPVRSIAFTGDALIHTQLNARAALDGDATGRRYDFRPMFDPISEYVGGADLALCHLEVPLSATDTNLSGYPAFNAPREVADGLADAGFDGCSTASNHSLDQGAAGVIATISVLDDAGLGHAGTSETSSEPTTTYDVGGVDVAHIAATWWLNGLTLPPDSPWLVDLIDTGRIEREAAEAKAAGADIVIVSVHCCLEYQTEPTAYQREVDRALIDSPSIDLVVGHHAHVVQPIEYRNGKYIVYGLGNMVSAQRRIPETIDGVIVIADFALRRDHWEVREIRFIPTFTENGTYRVVPAIGDDWFATASWKRTVQTITSYDPPGVTPTKTP